MCAVVYWPWQTLFQLFHKKASLRCEKITTDLASQRNRKKNSIIAHYYFTK